MKIYTVIGYWPDSMQRFAEHVEAIDHNIAEEICLKKYDVVAVCGVLAGHQQPVDTCETVRTLSD